MKTKLDNQPDTLLPETFSRPAQLPTTSFTTVVPEGGWVEY